MGFTLRAGDGMKIKVRYFAALRDQRGVSQEFIEIPSMTPAELYTFLRTEHGFSLTLAQVRFAVNNQYVEGDQLIQDGDELVFIPPVAGG